MAKQQPMRPISAKPTKEQLEAEAKRAFLQKRNSLAEGILFNAVRHVTGTIDYKPYVDAAVEAADHMMKVLYSVAITSGENDAASEKKEGE